jgi:hypothetical protein
MFGEVATVSTRKDQDTMTASLPQRFATFTVSAALGAFMIPDAYAQRAPFADNAARAQAVIQAAYPSLAGGRVFTVNADRWRPLDGRPLPLLGLTVTVGERTAGYQNDVVINRVSINVEFTEDGVLYALNANNELTNGPRRAELARVLKSATPQSPGDVSPAIKAAGGRFGPDASAAMRAEVEMRFEALAPVLGRAHLRDLSFISDRDGPYWIAELTIDTHTGERRFNALFEPFDGRLFGISRIQSWRPVPDLPLSLNDDV